MLKKTVKKIRRSALVRGVVIATDFLATLTLNCFNILSALQKILGCRRVVMLTEGGFGHTVTAPDIARRVFSDQKTLVIIFSIRGRHNLSLSKIWTDIDVIHLWKYLYFYSRHQSVSMSMLVLGFLRFVFRKQVYMVTADAELKDASQHAAWAERQTLYQLFVKQQIDRYGPIAQSDSLPSSNEFLLYWVRNVFLNPMPEPMLPRVLDKSFMQKMESINPKRTGMLAVYMRRKGEAADSLTRCGGTYEEYRPIFEAAHNRGLLVLILGDLPLEECPPDLRANLHDERSFDLDKEWYSLATVIKCNYFVGDPGGGSVLPCLLQMPKVMVNAFPYSQAWPGFLIMYKRLENSKGMRVPLAECFNEFLWTFDFDAGYSLKNNLPTELASLMNELFDVPTNKWQEYVTKSNFTHKGTYARQGARLCDLQYRQD